MAAPSMHSNRKHCGGCHYSKCLGVHQRKQKGKSTDEVQSKETGRGTLAESCFNAENSATDRWILASLEKELQAAFRFADGNGETENSFWVV